MLYSFFVRVYVYSVLCMCLVYFVTGNDILCKFAADTAENSAKTPFAHIHTPLSTFFSLFSFVRVVSMWEARRTEKTKPRKKHTHTHTLLQRRNSVVFLRAQCGSFHYSSPASRDASEIAEGNQSWKIGPLKKIWREREKNNNNSEARRYKEERDKRNQKKHAGMAAVVPLVCFCLAAQGAQITQQQRNKCTRTSTVHAHSYRSPGDGKEFPTTRPVRCDRRLPVVASRAVSVISDCRLMSFTSLVDAPTTTKTTTTSR